jgi:hypothetical protein
MMGVFVIGTYVIYGYVFSLFFLLRVDFLYGFHTPYLRSWTYAIVLRSNYDSVINFDIKSLVKLTGP